MGVRKDRGRRCNCLKIETKEKEDARREKGKNSVLSSQFSQVKCRCIKSSKKCMFLSELSVIRAVLGGSMKSTATNHSACEELPTNIQTKHRVRMSLECSCCQLKA